MVDRPLPLNTQQSTFPVVRRQSTINNHPSTLPQFNAQPVHQPGDRRSNSRPREAASARTTHPQPSTLNQQPTSLESRSTVNRPEHLLAQLVHLFRVESRICGDGLVDLL